MLVLLKLFLAHLIADFILQFEELFQLKLKSRWGHLLHAFCHLAVSLLFLFPYWKEPSILIFVVVSSFVHYFQDIFKYRFMGNKKYFFLIFMADQIVHFLVISTVLFVPASQKILGIPGHPVLDALYTEPGWTLFWIAFVGATFAGSFTFHSFGKSYLKDQRPDHFITSFEIFHGLLERGVLLGLFLFFDQPFLLILSPLVGLPRFFFKPVKNSVDFLLSFVYGSSLGVIFRLWI